jgi:hypothetical protein
MIVSLPACENVRLQVLNISDVGCIASSGLRRSWDWLGRAEIWGTKTKFVRPGTKFLQPSNLGCGANPLISNQIADESLKGSPSWDALPQHDG